MYKFYVSKQNGSSMLHGDYLDANLIDEKEYNKLMFLKQYVFDLYQFQNEKRKKLK